DAGMEAVAALGHEPVGVGDAGDVPRPRRATEREVVLGAAVNVIEGRGVVHGHVVELRDRQIGMKAPVGAAVAAFVNAAVAADEVITRIARVNPNLMVIDVLETLAELPERLAAV